MNATIFCTRCLDAKDRVGWLDRVPSRERVIAVLRSTIVRNVRRTRFGIMTDQVRKGHLLLPYDGRWISSQSLRCSNSQSLESTHRWAY
jgi:hypothetical protein